MASSDVGEDRLVLVDTSAWITAFRDDGSLPGTAMLDSLVADGRAAICAVVVAELLQGALSAQDLAALDYELAGLVCLSMDRASALAGRTAWQFCRRGITLPTTDLLIAATAAVHGAQLLHQDRHLAQVAGALGVATLEV